MLKKSMIVNINILFFITAGQSQNVTSVYTQNIKGVVMDSDAKSHLTAVTVTLQGAVKQL
jgi:hypothetical protein